MDTDYNYLIMTFETDTSQKYLMRFDNVKPYLPDIKEIMEDIIFSNCVDTKGKGNLTKPLQVKLYNVYHDVLI